MWAHAFAQPLPGLVLRRSQGPRPWNCPGATGARFFQLLTIAAHDWHANGMRNVRYAAMDMASIRPLRNSSAFAVSSLAVNAACHCAPMQVEIGRASCRERV